MLKLDVAGAKGAVVVVKVADRAAHAVGRRHRAVVQMGACVVPRNHKLRVWDWRMVEEGWGGGVCVCALRVCVCLVCVCLV